MMSKNKIVPVKIAIRVRPLLAKEKNIKECVSTFDDVQQIKIGTEKQFKFDYVFSKTKSQLEVYEEIVKPLLVSLFKSQNVTILFYGQPNSGKIQTMGYCLENCCSNKETGILPRFLNDLFRHINESKHADYSSKVSFVEVYNEEIRDLLNTKNDQKLKIFDDNNNSIKVFNLTEKIVSNIDNVKDLIKVGNSNRVVGATALNHHSIRSHAIFTVIIEELNKKIKSKINFVDLAAYEQLSKTQTEGLRQREGKNINLGLLALGNVISVLNENYLNNKNNRVPYRESVLTRFLKDSLGDSSNSLMIACVSPIDIKIKETLNTLRFASRIRHINKNHEIKTINHQNEILPLNNLQNFYEEFDNNNNNNNNNYLIDNNNNNLYSFEQAQQQYQEFDDKDENNDQIEIQKIKELKSRKFRKSVIPMHLMQQYLNEVTLCDITFSDSEFLY